MLNKLPPDERTEAILKERYARIQKSLAEEGSDIKLEGEPLFFNTASESRGKGLESVFKLIKSEEAPV